MKTPYTWRLRTYECGADGKATLPALLDLLQESASLNAEALKFSKCDFEARGENISWVLTKLRVHIKRYPKWGEEIKIVTWPCGGRKIVAYRDFEGFSADGERILAASSEWMLIDLASRSVMKIPQAVFAAVDSADGRALGDEPFSHLKWHAPEEPGAVSALSFRAMRSQIDLNGHVNNVHYARWMLETASEDFVSAREVEDFEIVFKSEVLAGAEIAAEGARIAEDAMLHRVCGKDSARDHTLARTVWRVKENHYHTIEISRRAAESQRT